MPTNAELNLILRLRDLASRKLTQVRGRIARFGVRVKASMAQAGAAFQRFRIAILAAVLAMGAMIKKGADFELSLVKIATLLKETDDVTRKFAPTIQRLAISLGQSADALASAQFDIVSAGIIDTEQAMNVLTASAKLATAGFTDTATAASATLTLIQTFPDAFKDAADATNFLIVTQQKARVTVGQLAQSLGKLLGIAADAGVNIEQLGAAFVLVKNTGLSTEETMTSLRALIIAMGREFGSASIEGEGFGRTIQALSELTKDARLEALKNIEALKAVGPITANLNDFRRLSIELAQREGSVDLELVKVLETMTIRFGQVGESVRFLGVAFAAGGSEQFKESLDKLRLSVVSLLPAFAALGAAVGLLILPLSLMIQVIAKLINLSIKALIAALSGLAVVIQKFLGVIARVAGVFNDEWVAAIREAQSVVKEFSKITAESFIEFEDEIAASEELARAFSESLALLPEQMAAIQKSIRDMANEAKEKFSIMKEVAADTANAMASALSDFFFAVFAREVRTASEIFAAFGKSMLRILAELIARVILFKVILTGLSFVPGIGPFASTIQAAGGFKKGGIVRGYQGGGEVPAFVTPGEFIVNREATKRNKAVLEQINAGGGPLGQPIIQQFFITATDADSFKAKIQQNAELIESIFQQAIKRNSGPMREMIHLA